MAGVQYKRREFTRILRDNGFRYVRTSGDHDIYKRYPGETAVIQGNPNALICRKYIQEFDLKIHRKGDKRYA